MWLATSHSAQSCARSCWPWRVVWQIWRRRSFCERAIESRPRCCSLSTTLLVCAGEKARAAAMSFCTHPDSRAASPFRSGMLSATRVQSHTTSSSLVVRPCLDASCVSVFPKSWCARNTDSVRLARSSSKNASRAAVSGARGSASTGSAELGNGRDENASAKCGSPESLGWHVEGPTHPCSAPQKRTASATAHANASAGLPLQPPNFSPDKDPLFFRQPAQLAFVR